MTLRFESVYLTASGAFLPGPPIDNDNLDRYIAPLNGASARIKRRILAENGIQTRHYAITEDGATLHSTAEMAAHAVRDCIGQSEIELSDLTALCSASSGGDCVLPG